MISQGSASYPKGETVWVEYIGCSGRPAFIVTSRGDNRSFYFLYELVGGSLQKLGKAHSPTELEAKYGVLERLGEK